MSDNLLKMLIIEKKMKPCPFCRSTIGLKFGKKTCECGRHDWVYIECDRCGMTGFLHYAHTNEPEEEMFVIEEKAIDLWNWAMADVQDAFEPENENQSETIEEAHKEGVLKNGSETGAEAVSVLRGESFLVEDEVRDVY